MSTNWVKNIEDLPLEDRLALPSYGQEHWYLLAAMFVEGRSVLEVGAGHGTGLRILSEQHPAQLGAIDPLPLGIGTAQIQLEQLAAASFEFVLAIDVIEHVQDDVGFLANILRVAKVACFITTPNFDVWHCENPLHIREYTPAQFAQLLDGLECIFYTVGKDRLVEPLREIASPHEASAQFAALIRSPALASDSGAWKYIRQRAAQDVPSMKLSSRLSRLSKWSSEWLSEMKALVDGKAYPANVECLCGWLKVELHATEAAPIQGDLAKIDPVLILQRGACTPPQEAAVLRWALEHVCGLSARRIDIRYPGVEACQLAVADGRGCIWTIEGLLMQITE